MMLLLMAAAPAAQADFPAESASAGAPAPMATDPIAEVVARVRPAVVKVVTVRPPPEPATAERSDRAREAAETRPMTTFGSGFIIDPRGFVATNKHVIDNAVGVFVYSQTGVRYKAQIVGLTAQADIALLKIDGWPDMPSLQFGDSDKLAVGDRVIAIGTPFGFEGSVTTGVVSALNRDIMESPFDDYIQTDAAINHGNSGGPLFDLAGKVVGMNSVLFAPGSFTGSVGLGFAIPASSLKFVFSRLETSGHIDAGMLPIRTQAVSWMLAQALGTGDLHGALVTSLDGDGDRMMQGQIKPGDIILTFNGQSVSDPRDLARQAAAAAVGSRVDLALQRGDQHLAVRVQVQPIPEATPPDLKFDQNRVLGLDLSSVPNQGVTVADIDLAGTAADSGIQKGDVIVQVQQEAAVDPAQVLRLMQQQSAAKRRYAALLVQRDGKTTWMPVAVPP